MRELEELTCAVESLGRAGSFKDAAEGLTRWARDYTGCQAAILRMAEEGVNGIWLPSCRADGHSQAFSRDEAIVSGMECICGRVASGTTDPTLPFFTEGGSFHWGRLATLESTFAAEDLGLLRGRCIREGYQSLAVFPLIVDDDTIGSLQLADPQPDLFAGSVEVIEAVCRLAGRILIQHRTREREHALLETLQAALLPAAPPQIDGLTIGTSFHSATEMAGLGGDFYDVIDLGDEGALVLVGDVSGKGLEAAGAAAQARYAMTALVDKASDPAAFMSVANKHLLELLRRERFVASVACLIRPGAAMVTTCLAGHPAPLHLRGVVCEDVAAPHNPPLGVLADAGYVAATTELESGDLLVVYTDGVADSRRGNRRFDSRGIGEVLTAHPGGEPAELAAQICGAAAIFHDDMLPSDDRLVLAIRID